MRARGCATEQTEKSQSSNASRNKEERVEKSRGGWKKSRSQLRHWNERNSQPYLWFEDRYMPDTIARLECFGEMYGAKNCKTYWRNRLRMDNGALKV